MSEKEKEIEKPNEIQILLKKLLCLKIEPKDYKN